MKAKFLNSSDVEATLNEIFELSSRTNIEVALAGGVAMELFGSDRLTKDVDFVCAAILPYIKVTKQLAIGGVSGLTAQGYPVDLIIRDDEYFELYQEALAHSIALPDQPLKVIAPEYLAAMKMVAGRDKDELDLKTLIRLEAIDLAQTEDIIRRHLGRYAVKEFKSLVSEVAWLKSKNED